MQRRDGLKEGPIYRGYRIHTSHRFGLWVSLSVSIGTRWPITADSLTEAARVPGEYPSEVEAIQAAKRDSDEAEAPRRE